MSGNGKAAKHDAVKRVYVVPVAGKKYLARAKTPTQAARWVLTKIGGEPYLAKQDDLIELISAGTEIFEAPVDAQDELDLPLTGDAAGSNNAEAGQAAA